MSETIRTIRMTPSTKEEDPIGRPYFGDEEVEAAAAVLKGGWIVGRRATGHVRIRFAELCGAHEAVGVSSGTTGGFLGLHALGIGPGDEVIVLSLTFIASVNVVRHTEATRYSPRSTPRPTMSIRLTSPARLRSKPVRSCRSTRSVCLATSISVPLARRANISAAVSFRVASGSHVLCSAS